MFRGELAGPFHHPPPPPMSDPAAGQALSLPPPPASIGQLRKWLRFLRDLLKEVIEMRLLVWQLRAFCQGIEFYLKISESCGKLLHSIGSKLHAHIFTWVWGWDLALCLGGSDAAGHSSWRLEAMNPHGTERKRKPRVGWGLGQGLRVGEWQS